MTALDPVGSRLGNANQDPVTVRHDLSDVLDANIAGEY